MTAENPQSKADARPARTRPVRATLFPIIALILAMAAAVASILVIGARTVDRHYADEAQARVKLVLENLQQTIATSALDYAWWDEAFVNLHIAYSEKWVENTVAASSIFGPDKGIDGVLVFGPDDALLFARWQGEPVDAASAGDLIATARHLAQSARGKVQIDDAGKDLGPVPQAGYLSNGGVVAMASAVAVHPFDDASLAEKRPGESVMIMLRTLTPEYLHSVGDIYGLADLRIDTASELPLAGSISDADATAAGVGMSVALPSSNGDVQGRMAWTPETPGQSLMSTMVPGAVIGFLLLSALALVVVYQILRIRRVTLEQFKVIEARNRELRHSAQMLGSTIQSIEDGIAVFDKDRRLKHWNRAYAEMWRFPEGFLRTGATMTEMLNEVRHGGSFSLMPTDDKGKPATDPNALEQSGRWVYQRSDGRQLSVRRVPIDDQGYMAICSDVTAQKQHEDELVKAWEQAVIANRSKSEFLANVSHELRTPLNAIIGFSEVVERELFGPLGNERYVSYVRDIRNSGEHLLSLINDILDLSKIEAGRFQLRMEEVDCNEVAQSVARLIRPRTVEHGLTMVLDLPEEPITLNADKRAVKQVLINLLSNAVKFTPESGTVTLACQPWQGGVQFTVRDTGIGIDEKDMHVALAPFGQIDSQFNRKYEGTGLGLPIVKGIIELHGGTLEINSKPGKGTTVVVRFPDSPPDHQSAEIVPMPRKQAASGH